MAWKLFILTIFLLGTSACVRNQPQIIVITSTPERDIGATPPTINADNASGTETNGLLPTLTATFEPVKTGNAAATQVYVVQAGDTLSGIAAHHGINLEVLLSVNNLSDPDTLSVGQTINLPALPSETTTSFKIIPDNRLVRGPGSQAFDIQAFINRQTGYIAGVTDTIDEKIYTAAEVVERAAREYSVDPRLLLALLEYQAGWLTNNDIDEVLKIYPLEREPSPPGFDRTGLYKQLAWAANQLNRGYYGWKERDWTTLEFEDGTRWLYSPELNAATVGVQYLLSQNNNWQTWQLQVSPDGFYQTYMRHFSDPFADFIDPLVPPDVAQPELTLPFPSGEIWFFTGGPHGGWGSGSAWSAIDFAPPDERSDASPPCYISQYWATAVAPGVVTFSEDGLVILDLDMDGDETTGWTILYLHISTQERIAKDTVIYAGDYIGHPSCEGGFSNGTHMHIARRYNGEWIPASCERCTEYRPPFVMSGWSVVGISGQEYQGYLLNGVEQRTAEQSRLTPINWVSW